MNKIEKFLFKNGQSIWDNYEYLTVLELIRELIKKMNEVIDETNTLEEIVIALRNWFNNLDVQDEVNKKLDEMVLDGTLAQIINEEIFSELSNKLNYYTVPENFGAIGDGITDDSVAIQQCIDYASNNKIEVRFLSKTYLISIPIILPSEMVKIKGNNSLNIGNRYGINFEERNLNTIIKANGDFPVFIFNGRVWSCSIEGIEITNSVRHRGIGLQINNSNNWIQDLILRGVTFVNMNIGVEVNMGDNVSTESGFVYSLFEKCAFVGNKSHGMYIRQTELNSKTWFNQNSFSNCHFSENGVGIEIERVTVQNLNFTLCSFEGNGFHPTDSSFKHAFAFKGIWVTDVTFNECYFENNLPHRNATESDIINFTTNGILNTHSNYTLGDEEYVPYDKTIRPLNNLPRGMYGDIICDGKFAGSKVIVTDSLFSLNYIYVTLLQPGTVILNNNMYYQTPSVDRRPSNILKAVIHLKNLLTNSSTIDNSNNVFYGSVVGVERILEVNGTIDNESVLKGQLDNSLLRQYQVSPYSIEGVNRIFVDSNNGNDNNIGVIENYPIKTLDKAIDRATNVKGKAEIILKGTFLIDKIYNIQNLDLVISGNGTATISTALYQNSGFLYIDLINSNVMLNNINVNLIKDSSVTNFTLNSLFRTQGNSSLTLRYTFLNSNDANCHISNVVGGTFSITGLIGNTFTGNGKLFKNTENSFVGYSGITNWL